MKKSGNKRRYSILDIVMLLTLGTVFVALGIGIIVALIGSVARSPVDLKDAFAAVIPIFLFGVLPIAGGTLALVFGGKPLYLWIRTVKTNKYGRDATAQILDYKKVSRKSNICVRYALILRYKDGEAIKKFTTDYLYDVNEYRYLRRLGSIKVKIHKNFVTVCEPFSIEIYKVDSVYGIDLAFYQQKPVKILLRLAVIFFLIALAFLFVSMLAIKNSACTKAAIFIVFAVPFPFVIPLLVYFIKWIRRKK